MYSLKMLLSITAISFCCLAAESQSSFNTKLQAADSFYFANDWNNAVSLYNELLTDTSTNSLALQRLGFAYYNIGKIDEALRNFHRSETANPPAAMQPYLYSRMAKAFSIKNDYEKAFEYLDKAVAAGYINLNELDSARDFASLRDKPAFKERRTKIYNTLYPCYTNARAREFDFWAGEWDVYATGTKNLVGHSIVQIISGGCALLENWEGQNSTGKSINFIDPGTNKWKQSWAGSYANGIQEFVNGEYKDSAMRFEFETKNAQGQKMIGRFIFYNEGANQVRQFNETSADEGKTWTTSYDFTYIRRK